MIWVVVKLKSKGGGKVIIKNVEKKRELLKRFYGKFYIEAIEDINYNAYLKLMNSTDFIETYDRFVIAVEKPKIKYYTTLYYNVKQKLPAEITEEEYIDYHLHQVEHYDRTYWITKEENGISYLTKNKTNKSLRQLTILELEEINKIHQEHLEKITRVLKAMFVRNYSIITRYEVWEKRRDN